MLEQIATVEICVGPPTLPNGRYILGLGFILAQCFVWIAASVLTQYMFQETVVESPFLMTYIGVALCMLMFPVQWFNDKWASWRAQAEDGQTQNDGSNPHNTNAVIKDDDSFDEALTKARDYQNFVDVMTTRSIQNAKTKKPWNHKKHVLAALQ